MKNLLMGIIFILNILCANAQPEFIQARAIGLGSSTAGGSTARAIALDRHDHIYIAGEFSDTVWFDATYFTTRINFYEPFIAKYDSNFNLIWAASPAGPRLAYGMALDTAGNAYITGYMGSRAVFGDDTVNGYGSFDTYLAKYDSQGRILWGRHDGGGGEDVAFAVATDQSGNAYVTGYFSATASFGPYSVTSGGDRDIFVVKYDSSGTPLWIRSAGGVGDDGGLAIAVDRGGDVYLTGYFEGTAVFGPDTVESVVPATNNVFIAKYDADGNYLWMRQPSGFVAAKGRAITANDAGNVDVTGDFQGTAIFGEDTLVTHGVSDIFVAKLSADGNMLWGRSGGGTGQDYGYAIAVDSTANVLVTGIVDDSPALFGSDTLRHNGYDIFVAKYSSDGVLRWLKAGGSIFQESSKGIAVNAAGDIYLGGGLGTPGGDLRLDSLTVHGIPGRGSTLLAKLRERRVSGNISSKVSEQSEASIYPNPSHGIFSLRWDNHTHGDATITISDLLGRTVYKGVYMREALQSGVSFTLEGLVPGLYLLRIISVGSVFSERLMIE